MRREQQTDTAVIPAEVHQAVLHSLGGALVLTGGLIGVDVAPCRDVQTRMMSRIERTPTTSPPSTITRWRIPRRAMSAAARSRLQSGAAVITESLMWSATRSASGSSPRPIETRTSRSLMIPGPGRLLVDDDRRADALLGHHPRRVAQRVTRPDGQNDLRHSLSYFHLSPSAPFDSIRAAQRTPRGFVLIVSTLSDALRRARQTAVPER